MNFFDHKDLGNHLLQLCPKVVKHAVYVHVFVYENLVSAKKKSCHLSHNCDRVNDAKEVVTAY
jgi:hypothetical protein